MLKMEVVYMTQGERVKEVRKANNLTMEKFGVRLGVTKTAISLIESGKNNLTDANIKLICTEFGISEKWLRTGDGEMTIESTQEERFATNIAKLQRTDDETIIKWVDAIAETSPEALKQVELFMKRLLGIEDE